MDAAETQRRTLHRLLRRAARTRFGRAHGFATIRSVEDYQDRVALRRYEAFWAEYWQPAFPRLCHVTWPGTIPYFAQSSGTTTGVTKRIPVSHAILRANRAAALDVLAFHLRARPRSRVFGGCNFLLGGSTSLDRLAPGVQAGDLSGIVADRMPWWVRGRGFPPRELALLGDWERKMAALAPASLHQDIRSLSGSPSWMLLFLDQLAALRPDQPRRLAAYYPNLELVVHGGVSFAPYRDRFAAWLEGSRAETREVYPASEGFIAAADRGPDEGLRLLLDRGLFHEFVPVGALGALAALDQARPDRRWIGTAEAGVEYALVLTSSAGLWSYILGDTVMLTSLDPPRLRITGRLGFTLSAFGEHVSAEELEAAVMAAASGAGVTDYAVAPRFPDPASSRGQHVFVVELAAPVGASAPAFARVLDETLARRNADYADHRRGDFGVLPPDVRLVPPGTFAGWMRARGRLGGQHKVPRVINDPALRDGLLRYIDRPV